MTFPEKSYPLFIYLGIVFFIIHLFIYGIGFDLSFFGLFLVYIGYHKTQLSGWFLIIIWILVLIEIMNLGNIIYNKYLKPGKKKEKGNEKKPKKKCNSKHMF